jgi:hypothetical protein
MALPTTISGFSWPTFSRNLGPFISSGGNVYAIGGTSGIAAYKATDPTSSFSEQDATNSPAFTGAALGIACHQEGDLLHIVVHSASDSEIHYSRFNMATDAWVEANNFGGSAANYEVSLFSPTDASTTYGVDITVRSDGDVIVTYHGENPSTMGGTYQEIAYSRWEGSSWTNGVVVASTAGKNENRLYPSIVMGSSDQAHIFYFADDLNDQMLRALNSGNALQTERTITRGVYPKFDGEDRSDKV